MAGLLLAVRDLAAVALYLAALLGGLAAFDAGDGWVEVGYAMWLVPSFALGIGTGRPWLFLVPLAVAVPMAIPFDYAENSTGEIWVPMFAAIVSVPAAALVLLGAAVRIKGSG